MLNNFCPHKLFFKKIIYGNVCGVIILVLLFLTSCSHRKKSIEEIVKELTAYECRAIHLRNLRFELADKIRFTQDSLQRKTLLKIDTAILHTQFLKMNIEKQSLFTQSIQLADSIKGKMDFIIANYLTDKTKEAAFNNLLNAALKNNDCK